MANGVFLYLLERRGSTNLIAPLKKMHFNSHLLSGDITFHRRNSFFIQFVECRGFSCEVVSWKVVFLCSRVLTPL